MPVVEKIEVGLDLGYNVVCRNHKCIIYRYENSPYEIQITDLIECNTKIEAVYKAVIQFILWFNKDI